MGIELGIGAAVMSFAGASSTFIAGGLGGVIAGAITGAVVGAAIGGLSAAVMGGSIGKGMLFGALGGAVTGGISGYLGSSVDTAMNVGAQGADGLAVSGFGQGLPTSAITEGTREIGNAGISASLESVGAQVGAEVIKTGLGGYMAAEQGKDAAKAAAKASELNHARDIEKMKLASELAGGAGGGGGGGGTDNTAAELGYKARMAELGQRKHEFSTTTETARKEWDTEMERRQQRRGLFKGAGDVGKASAPTSDTSVIQKRQETVEAGTPTALGGPTPAPEVIK